MKKNVLFLCTGNSCRSQMAEGLLRHFSSDKYNVFSAGVSPTKVNENAIEVMKEIGIDISHHKSKSVDEFKDKSFDIIITVCDNAKQNCPFFPGLAERIHWDIIDPAEALGSQVHLLEAFREVRDEITKHIKNEL